MFLLRTAVCTNVDINCYYYFRVKEKETSTVGKFGRDNLAADVPEGTQGVFILTAKEQEAKL